MSRDSSGIYTLPAGNPVVNGTAIDPSWANTTLTDIGNELTNSLDKAGRTLPTANLPMGGFKLSGLGAGSAAGESLRYEQVALNGETAVAISASTTNIESGGTFVVTLTGTATVTAFVAASVVGLTRLIRFNGAMTLTHNSSTFDLPGGSNITTASGDEALVKSTTTGWKFVAYFRENGLPVLGFPNGTVSAPGISFASEPDCGFYRVTTNTIALSVGGFRVMQAVNDSGGTFLYGYDPVASGTSGGPVGIRGGVGFTTGNGGSAQVLGGDGGSSGTGGNVIITAGDGYSSSGGSVTITGGSGVTGTIPGGAAGIRGGTAAVNGLGGYSYLEGGLGTGTGAGGDARIVAGNSGGGALGNILFETPTDRAFRITGSGGHLEVVDAVGVPTVTSGAGTSPAIVGTDTAFRVTMGATGSPGTTVRITFAVAFAQIPMCQANYQTSNIACRCVPTTGYVDVIFASAPANSSILDVFCIGRQAS